jgi:hypothetical protein
VLKSGLGELGRLGILNWRPGKLPGPCEPKSRGVVKPFPRGLEKEFPGILKFRGLGGDLGDSTFTTGGVRGGESGPIDIGLCREDAPGERCLAVGIAIGGRSPP